MTEHIGRPVIPDDFWAKASAWEFPDKMPEKPNGFHETNGRPLVVTHNELGGPEYVVATQRGPTIKFMGVDYFTRDGQLYAIENGKERKLPEPTGP